MSRSIVSAVGGSRLSLTLLLALVAVLLTSTGCQPKGERPGFGLRGTRAPDAVKEWRFTDGIEEIEIQTRTWYALPHSTTIWCAQLDGTLYLGSYGAYGDDRGVEGKDGEDAKKYWERNVARNPAATLRIAGTLYDVTLTPVAEPGLIEALDAAYATKYDMVDVFGDDVPEWWYYAVSLRDP